MFAVVAFDVSLDLKNASFVAVFSFSFSKLDTVNGTADARLLAPLRSGVVGGHMVVASS